MNPIEELKERAKLEEEFTPFVKLALNLADCYRELIVIEKLRGVHLLEKKAILICKQIDQEASELFQGRTKNLPDEIKGETK